MLNISDYFFKEESRCGYTISEAMKKGWAIQLTVLDEVLSIAKKHELNIWMEYGSLIGAVRHNGYVPWDDDIDICMPREDYMKFLFILQKELPPFRKVYSFYTCDNYPYPKAFVCCRDVIDLGISEKEASITNQLYNCPYATGIDIFPLDFIPANTDYWNYLSQLYSISYNLGIDYEVYLQTNELDSFLSQLEQTLNYHVSRDGNLRDSIWKLTDAISMMTTKEEAKWLTWYPEYTMCGDRRKRSLEAYSETIMVDFEMIKVPIPVGYDEVLKSEYGENYMTPIKGTTGHDYPFYKNQERKILFHNRIGQIGDIF